MIIFLLISSHGVYTGHGLPVECIWTLEEKKKTSFHLLFIRKKKNLRKYKCCFYF